VGPLVMFGVGGILVEALGDVVFRLAPLNRGDARDMLKGIRSVRLLDPIRGAPAANLTALEDVLIRVSRLAIDFPELKELDLNPVVPMGDGALVLDGRVMLELPTPVS
jgi:acyl-CoA synthetase (NDP forming)